MFDLKPFSTCAFEMHRLITMHRQIQNYVNYAIDKLLNRQIY